MVVLAQLVRARPCGGRGRRFEPGIPPHYRILTLRIYYPDFEPYSVKIVL